MVQKINTNNATTTSSTRNNGKILAISDITTIILNTTMNTTDNSSSMYSLNAFCATNLAYFIVDTFLNTAIRNQSNNTADTSTTW